METKINQSIPRIEAWDKVTGYAKYTDDLPVTNCLCARILPSPHAHALIKRIHTRSASELKGVNAIITGEDFPLLTGPLIADRPPIAKDYVRYSIHKGMPCTSDKKA